jgi:hypothetical protein
MRILALVILAIGTVLTPAPVRAQTYGGNYPVCLQAYGRAGGYIECGYTSLAQCNASASGRSAQCIINPYFASAGVPRVIGGIAASTKAYFVNRIGRRTIFCMLPIAALAIMWNLFGG